MDTKLKVVWLIGFLMLPFFNMAQCRSLSRIYEAYDHLDDSFSLNINGGFLKMASWFDDKHDDDYDDEDIDDVMQSINRIKIYKIPKGFRGIDKVEVRRFKKDLYHEDFEELMNIRQGNEIFYVMAKERRGIVDDLVIYGESDDAVIFIEFLGSMNSKKVAKLCRKIEFGMI